MKRPGDTELNQPRTGRRIGSQGGQLILGARGDDLPAAIVVGCSQAMCCQSEEYVVRIATDDGSHGGWGRRTGLGHCTAALPYKNHRLLCGQNADARRGSHLSDGVTGNDADERISIGRVGEQLEGGE
jgi:hypothetical protein